MPSQMPVLAGVRVLEFSSIGPTPWAAMLMADMGADVVHIARDADGVRSSLLRGRKLVGLDLKSAEGVQSALQLTAHADILIEGMRPGAMERLGLGPDRCLRTNPSLVYGRMTGWGQDGPLAQRAGHDINYIALTGALHAIGGDGPVVPLNLVGDFGGGGAFLLFGVLAALLHARATGTGQVVDAAMVDGVTTLMTLLYLKLAQGQWTDRRMSNVLDGAAPWYAVYETADHKHMAVGAIETQFYDELLIKLGLRDTQMPDREDPRNWPLIREALARRFREQTRDFWTRHFLESDACVTPVLSMAEAPQHPHHRARNGFIRQGDHSFPNMAPRFSRTPANLAPAAKNTNVHEVMKDWAAIRGAMGQRSRP